MDMRRQIVGFFLIVLSVLLAACEGEQTALPTITSEPLDYIELPLGPDEIIHIAGEVSLVSKPFALEGPGGLKVYWKQDCEEFILSMVNTNEALAEAPLGTLFFEGMKGPSQYVEDYPGAIPFEYVPGEYSLKIDVKGQNCTWEVWAKVVYPEGE